MPTRTAQTYPNRISLEAVKEGLSVFVPVTVKDTFPCSQGDVLGKITASSKYRRRSRSTLTVAFATNSTTGTVTDGTLFKAGDVITKSDGTAIGTILSISGNVITLTANATNAAAIGADVIATDGSAVAACIADKTVDGSGDTTINACIGGYLKEASLAGLDATAKTELGGYSRANGIFRF